MAYLGLLIFGLVLMCVYPKLELHLLLNSFHTPVLDIFFKYYSMVAEGLVYVLALLPLFWKKYRITLFFGMSEVTGGAIVQILKHSIATDRPACMFERYGDAALPLVQGVDMHYGNSFPSGHASTFFVFFTCCAIIMAYHHREQGCRKDSCLLPFHLSMLSLLLLAALGAYSRVYLSQHFLSDICVGSIIGFVCPFLIYRFAGKRILLPLLLMLTPLTTMAQDITGTVPIPTPKKEGGLFALSADSAKGKPALLQPVYWVKTLIDTSAIATIDRDYIEQPKRAWAIEARTTLNRATMRMEATWEDPSLGNLNMWTKTDNGLSASVGLWVGYRGYGIGYSREIGSTTGSTFSFGAMGGSFGLNLRISNYSSDMPEIALNGNKATYDTSGDRMEDPIKIHTFFLDGYYMFNGKHYSYAAAYDQSLIQKRSAGSLMVGAMYCYTSADYSDDSNWVLTTLMKNVGKVKFTQASLGVGYAYNWVPARGWLISAMAMPMLTLYNRTTKYLYDINPYNPNLNFDEDMNDDQFLDYLMDDNTTFKVSNEKEEKTGNSFKLNFDARLSVVYNWERCYLRVYGHYNRFPFGTGIISGLMTDWTAYAALGFRF